MPVLRHSLVKGHTIHTAHGRGGGTLFSPRDHNALCFPRACSTCSTVHLPLTRYNYSQKLVTSRTSHDWYFPLVIRALLEIIRSLNGSWHAFNSRSSRITQCNNSPNQVHHNDPARPLRQGLPNHNPLKNETPVLGSSSLGVKTKRVYVFRPLFKID